VLYTGGTTGMPKGVMWRQEDVFFSGMMGGNPTLPPPERPEDVSERVAAGTANAGMTAAPLIHGAAQLGTWIALLQGWKACLVPRFDPHLVWQTVQDEKVLSLSIVGDAMARPLAEALDEESYDLAGLFVMGSAGAVWTQPVKDQLKAKLPNLTLLDSFGASETGAQGMDAGGVQAEGGIRFRMNPGSVVLDDADRPIAPGSGQTGRLAMKGRVPLGYWKDPAKTAKTFVTIDGVRHVLLGDLARPEADGTVTVFGRGSQCINSGGEKIFPEEVEGALKSHPDVFDAVVVGLPDPKWGEAGRGGDRAAAGQAAGARRRDRARAQARRRLQGAALRVRRRPHGPLAERETRLSLGEGICRRGGEGIGEQRWLITASGRTRRRIRASSRWSSPTGASGRAASSPRRATASCTGCARSGSARATSSRRCCPTSPR
jgi:hypothetical protein